MHNKETDSFAREIVQRLIESGLTLATAESCTGGAIAKEITAVPGCSAVFKGAVVAYSNEVKAAILGVSKETLLAKGAVSEETVKEMVTGACKALRTDFAVATSGIAGPGGGTAEKPVGMVWMAAGTGSKVETRLLRMRDNGREKNIALATQHALLFLLQFIEHNTQ